MPTKADLNAAIDRVESTLTSESTEIKKVIQDLIDKNNQVPEVDLSPEIARLDSIVTRISNLVTPEAEPEIEA